jgi:DNA-binding SARP family transcriptional activator
LEKATRYAIEAFDLAQQYGYKALLTGPTLFGPRDQMMLVPILLAARDDPARRDAAQALLKQAFSAIASDDTTQSYHPGVTLRIQTLGPMRVWRGHEEIGPHEWQRKKAQQLLALLITNRDHWLLREQICDWLWPELSEAQVPGSLPDVESQFKVTLNGLNSALEPLRPPRTPPFYIRRQGGAYRFFPPCGVWLDVEEFEDTVTALEADVRREFAARRAPRSSRVRGPEGTPLIDGRVERSTDHSFSLEGTYEALTAAVELYQGEYLSDWLYEDWARDERQRLAGRYLQVATLLAEALVVRDELSKAVRLCETILARDPGWEDAYRVLIRAHMQQGNRRLALAAYERCVRNLREYLDVEPLPSTVALYEEVKRTPLEVRRYNDE